jgi:hypothetical protein
LSHCCSPLGTLAFPRNIVCFNPRVSYISGTPIFAITIAVGVFVHNYILVHIRTSQFRSSENDNSHHTAAVITVHKSRLNYCRNQSPRMAGNFH